MDASVKILIEAVDKASPELKKFQDNLVKTEKSMVQFAARAGAVMGAAIVGIGAAMVTTAIKTTEMIERMGELAAAAGTSVEEFTSLNYAASTAGVSTEQLSTAFNMLNKSMVEANKKSSAAAAAFRYLKVETKNADGTYRKNVDVMRDVATAFAKMPDGVSKSAVAMEIFGRAGAGLIPFLNQGATGIAALQQEAVKLGVVLDTETVDKAQKFGDQVDRLKGLSSGAAITLSAELLPSLKVIADILLLTAEGGNFVTTTLKIVGEVAKVLTFTLTGLYVAFELILDIATRLGGFLKHGTKGMDEISGAGLRVAHAMDQLKIMAAEWYGLGSDESAAQIRKELERYNTTAKKATEATDEFNGTNDEAAKAAAKLAAEFDRVVESLQKEADGYKDLTAVEKVLQQIRSGSYAKFTAAQQAKLINLAKEIDLNEKLRDLQQKLSAGNVAVYGAVNNLSLQTRELTDAMGVLLTKGQDEYDLFVKMQQPISDLTRKLGELQLAHDEALKAGENKQAGKLENDIKAVESQLATYEKLAEFSRKQLEDQQRINQETKTWNTYIGESRNKVSELDKASSTLNGWLKSGTISAQEFAVAIEKINEEKFANMRANVTALQKKVADVAATIQSTLGDTFYNIMQGNFKDIGEMFKQMLDRMVADALAANLAKMLFGDFTNTGSVSGTGGGLLTSGVSALLGAGFGRESGGPVTAGNAYIVGERRPELFIPQTNGTIMPDTSAINGGGGNQISFSITAMDSQDVIRAMDKIKRPLTEMINGTNKSYNMR